MLRHVLGRGSPPAECSITQIVHERDVRPNWSTQHTGPHSGGEDETEQPDLGGEAFEAEQPDLGPPGPKSSPQQDELTGMVRDDPERHSESGEIILSDDEGKKRPSAVHRG